MANKSYAKIFGFKNGEAYPVLFKHMDNGKIIAVNPEHKTFSFPFEKLSEETASLKKGTYRRIKGYVPMSAFTQDNLVPNDANPRNGIYSPKRKKIVRNLCENPFVFPFSFGCSIIVTDMECKDNEIEFETKKAYKSKVTGEIRKTGCSNGQNLMYITATINEKINRGEFEYKFDTNKVKIPVELIQFSDDVPNSDILEVCEIENSTVQQSATAIATMRGDFNKYLFNSIVNGIERKFGEAKTDVAYRTIVKSLLAGKHDKDEEEMTRCVGSRMDIVTYMKMAAMIFFSAQKKNYYEEEIKKLEKWKKGGYSKTDISEERKDIRKKSVDKIIHYGRHKMDAAKEVLKAHKGNSIPTFHPALNEPLMNKFCCEAYDFVVSFDYSDYLSKNENAKENLGFVRYSENTLSPFEANIMHYKMPVGIVSMVPFLFGSLCDIEKDADEVETVVCNIDFKKFWAENYSDILDKINEYKETSNGKVEYAMYDTRVVGCVNLWNQLRDICTKKKSKYIVKK